MINILQKITVCRSVNGGAGKRFMGKEKKGGFGAEMNKLQLVQMR